MWHSFSCSFKLYIQDLVAKGYKVAICEQVEDPAKAKGIVKRDVIKVITPGTFVDSNGEDEYKNTYINSLYMKNDEYYRNCIIRYFYW